MYEQILKKNEQIYALLAVATALCPTANRLLDEAVANTLREKCVPCAWLRLQLPGVSHAEGRMLACNRPGVGR